MAETLLLHEPQIRLTAFLFVLVLMALWELAAPKRRQEIPRLLRWSNNIALVAVDTAVVRLAFPILAVGLALIAEERGFGLLHWLGAPYWLAFLLAFLALDLVIYLQHRAFHAVPVLWRLHRMHHADLEFDASTGLRFHPAEIVLSMLLKLAVVAALGAPAAAVLVFEIVLNATSLFNHGNVRLPERVDRVLRLVVVTPDMHRVHHSAVRRETDSNFGFNLPWWDWLFATYRAQPEAGHHEMTIGLKQLRDPDKNSYLHLLVLPFVDPAGDYDISSREIEEDDREVSGVQREASDE